MDNAAIQELQAAAAAIEAQKTVESNADYGGVVLPPGYKLINMEALQEHRNMFAARYTTFNAGI